MNHVALLAILALLPADVFAAPAQRVCMAANGSIAVRPKCSAKETQLNANAINAQAAAGPSKLDIAACRKVTASGIATENTSGVAGVTAQCQTGEFILTYGFYYSQHSANLEQAALLSSDGMVADGVQVVTNQDPSACFSLPEYCNYTLTVTATCCPR